MQILSYWVLILAIAHLLKELLSIVAKVSVLEGRDT